MSGSLSQRMTTPSASFDAGDVGEEDEGVGVGGDGAGGGHFVGVDVVVFAVEAEGDAADDGHGAHGPDGVEPFGIGGGDFADEAEVVLGVVFLRARKTWPSPPVRPIGGLAAVAEGGDERFVDAAAEDHEGGVAGFGVGDAEAGDELRLLAHLLEQTGELDAAAVDQGDAVAVPCQIGDRAGAAGEKRGVFERGTAEFYDELHGCGSGTDAGGWVCDEAGSLRE